MGWDVSIVRVQPKAMKSLPCPADEVEPLADLRADEVRALLESCPGVRANGPPEEGWLAWHGAEGLMELRPSEHGIFVGHAKLEPLLALHAHLERARPGWALLDHVRGDLHDPDSLRRELARRHAQVEELLRQRGK
jgi:hypothetical protein